MKTKNKAALIIGISAASAVAVLIGVFCLLYFVYQIPLFDRSGWHETETGAVQYWDYYGSPMTQWLDIDGKRYYFAPDSGDMQIGWLETEEGRYYMDADGAMHTGWLETDTGRYFLNAEGVMHTGWLETEEGRYYLNDRGIMHTGWLDHEEKRYYLADDGCMTVGWLEINGSWYFFDETGALRTGWMDWQEARYYLNEDGVMQTGWLDMPEGRYYLSETGSMSTGWIETPEGRYYLNEQGLLQTNWLETPDGWYYLRDDGSVYTGWQTIDGKKYYFNDSGAMVTGWITCADGRYYLYEDGSLATSFVEIDGVERYFTEEGAYIPLVNPWNAVPKDYVLNLVNLEGYQVDASCRDMLLSMMEACRAEGHTCVLNSTYRSISTQQYLWDNRYNDYIAQGLSPEEAKQLTWQVVAYPGTSEHHLGLAIDIVGTDAMYAWLQAHSWEYGFIVRYPENKIDVTGIIYEPWHIRYVGKEMAKAVYESGLCLEEYLQMLKTQ